MDIKPEDVLNISVETLASEQYDLIKKLAAKHLRMLAQCLEENDIKTVLKNLSLSYAGGDGTGDENQFIDFSFIHKDLKDMGDVIEKLANLKAATKKNTKKNT